jgi:hypothetical protein
MKNTWASGAVELLRHADSHVYLETAFDKRIAFISIDNCVETSIRTFLSLPSSKSGIVVSRKDMDEAENSFPKLLLLLFDRACNRLTGLDAADIEHYHRIRNKLYHDGTGLSVDGEYLLAYRQIAAVLLQNLFSVPIQEPGPTPDLGRLILLWNQLDRIVRTRLRIAEKNGKHINTLSKLTMGASEGIFDSDDIAKFLEIRGVRNDQVHSEKVDKQQVEYAVNLAEKLILKLGGYRP